MYQNAIKLLEENENLINWCQLSKNPSAIHLLKNNKNKINYYYLSLNPNIFTYNHYLLK
jgi:hypothetical protein